MNFLMDVTHCYIGQPIDKFGMSPVVTLVRHSVKEIIHHSKPIWVNTLQFEVGIEFYRGHCQEHLKIIMSLG